PLSIAAALRRLISAKPYEEKDLFFDNGQWHSASHHSSFSDNDKSLCLQKINSRLAEASENLRNARHLFITFGTAWVYEWADGGETVGNCHKLPAKNFKRRRLNIEEIVEKYNDLTAELLAFNPNLNIIFTVSPIRHWKDGAHENQLSKSTLLLAIDRLKNENLDYFPAYEIVNDDLRDYRFYASDMIHLSDVAIDYIWERVGETFFSAKTRKLNDEITQINKAREHRPFNPESEEYQDFLRKIEEKENELWKNKKTF
ncbi:MAG: GSCFA domain-containing protein, partial [Prevotellaceae bacterium]|nr:GSCFA domain-containing protein [Prevotellaceae bacterium]